MPSRSEGAIAPAGEGAADMEWVDKEDTSPRRICIEELKPRGDIFCEKREAKARMSVGWRARGSKGQCDACANKSACVLLASDKDYAGRDSISAKQRTKISLFYNL